ncbi:MAG TPA: PQQ-binding-like beta-propeller repeat protein [Tepidisphaeraceae bacterium]|jgi:outer membrane protein assembly factor BamB|nr:PQQ-binding-like beta-propeller repeat protein [Tepidisphaeraceae bacterium]
MTPRYFLSASLACGVCLLITSTALSQDWPQWRGPNRDGKVSGFTAPDTWPKTLTEKWKVNVGAGDSTPALVGDKLYVFAELGTDEVTLCLDAGSGKEVWSDKYPSHGSITGAPTRHGKGPRSSPLVADGKVVTLDFAGVLSCLDAGTGKVIWRKDRDIPSPPRFFVGTSPIVVDGMCIVRIGGGEKGGLSAFDLNTGDAKWQRAGDGAAYASPVLAKIGDVGQIVEESEKFLNGVDAATGKQLWQTAFAGRGMAYNAATPIIDGDTVICTGHGTKAFAISKEGDAFAARELWSNDQVGTQFNTPVLKDGKLYGLSSKGNFFCMDARSGKVLWTDTAKHQNFCAIVDAGAVLFALPPDGQLTVIKPDDQTFEAAAKYKVSDNPTYAHPVLAGDRIYIKDKDSLTLFLLTGKTAA